jgi:hypothetical protein
MTGLRVHKDFQAVRSLPFCYLCGRVFEEGDEVDGDHVPPKAAFNARDREPTLKLRTHRTCNGAFSVDDKKVAQLIALRRRQAPSSYRDAALRFAEYPGMGVALTNLNVDYAVWRWIRGFHAALYRQPLVTNFHAIVTPFPRGDLEGGLARVHPLRPQHPLAVSVIKHNRAAGNLDQIVANNQQLRYECAWCESDDGKRWFCMFALDIYDWKDLGSHTADIPARGCTGVYALPDYSRPETATIGRRPPDGPTEGDPFDAFGR